MKQILLFFVTLLCSISANLNAQQEYSGNSVLDCIPHDRESPSPDYLYNCNGKFQDCKTFLIFRSQPPYDSVAAISNLMSVEPSELARVNNVTATADFDINKEVIIPVTCSCSGKYYQANSSYVTRSDDETYFLIANDTYEGLSSCSSLKDENRFSEFEIHSGLQLTVPLRCACPTSEQIENGVLYLLTYSISWNDSLSDISDRFNASLQSTADANKFSDIETTIDPSTTILIPLTTAPSISQTHTHLPLPVSPLPPVRLAKNKRSSKRIYLYTGIGVGVGVGSACLVFLVTFVACNCYKKKTNRCKGLEEGGKGNKKWVLPEDLAGIAHVERVLKVFSIEELEESTNNFSSVCKIKGSVYHGIINGGVSATIKMMSRDVTNEVRILNKVNHFNLITLHGFCTAQGNSFLVYEYMENGSLKDWLSYKRSLRVLSWNQRMQIALDVANGLHYLHNCIKPVCIHKNIKSSNILLNGNLRAKIANFSLAIARLGDMEHKDKFSSTHVTGTTGYLAPEYLETGLVTPMLDVYAFGVVMLELITGKSVALMHEGNELLLSTQMVSLTEGGNLEAEPRDWIDPSLPGNYRLDSVLAATKLSTACLRGNPANRPSMDEMVSSLTKILVDSLNSEYFTLKKA